MPHVFRFRSACHYVMVVHLCYLEHSLEVSRIVDTFLSLLQDFRVVGCVLHGSRHPLMLSVTILHPILLLYQ